MRFNLGDVPTWIAAIGTVSAFGAVITQMRIESTVRRELDTKEATERHRSQATLISSMPGPIQKATEEQSGTGQSAVDCINGSLEPVYNVVVCIVFVQGASGTLRTTEEMMELRLNNDNFQGVPVAVMNLLPPGRFRAWVSGTGWTSVLTGRPGTEIAFTDRSGSHWIRRVNGALNEIDQDPLSYFRRFGFNGPYDFQTPTLI